MGVDETSSEFLGMRRRVTDAPDAGYLGDILEQQRKIRDHAVGHPAAIGVDVLPEQGHFLHALVGEVGDLGEHVVERAGHFLAARVGDDTEAAILAAALHDRDEGARSLDARRGKPVELLDLGEGDVHLGSAGAAPRVDQLRQPVQRLRAEHKIDIGRARHYGRAFLAGDAAAHADEEVAPRLLQVFHAAEIVKHFFLRPFSHRAGVEQDQVRVFGPVGDLEAPLCAQQVRHPVRVVLVHLAAEGANEEFFRHASGLRASAARAQRVSAATREEPARRDPACNPPRRLRAGCSSAR